MKKIFKTRKVSLFLLVIVGVLESTSCLVKEKYEEFYMVNINDI